MFGDFVDKFHRDGYAVIEDFLTEAEIKLLKNEVNCLIENMPEQLNKSIFNTKESEMVRDQYFLDSSDKISYFFENKAIDSDGKLLVEPHLSLNKIGHALHDKNKIFRKITFHKRTREICSQLKLADPVIVHSTYIFKNPNVGGEVVAHQDGAFLHTQPMTLVGFWIALDDVTIENGCLWFDKESHKNGIHRRFIRNPDSDGKMFLKFTAPPVEYNKTNFTAVPVKKGTCILIHGEVVHYSESNNSSKPRNAYTFHVMDQKNSKYSKNNWLQVPNGTFLRLNEE